MLNDNDAAGDAAAAHRIQLRKMFDNRLYSAAEQLVDAGCVFDVRILQSGRVITGIARAVNDQTAKHRVYIHRGLDVPAIDGECSCGERSPCVHVAAVSIAAAKNLGKPPDSHRKELDPVPQGALARNAPERNAPAQQRLCYLFAVSGVEEPEFNDASEFQLSVWVAETRAGGRRIQAGACAFAPRTPEGNAEYPHYVDAQDRRFSKHSRRNTSMVLGT
jgi:hypothetical protein